MNESEVRKIVRGIIETELGHLRKRVDRISDDVKSLNKTTISEKEVRKIIREIIIDQYKWMWNKMKTAPDSAF